MLVGHLGAPCSGKTTVASRLFADLKESAHTCELITEKARTIIAFKKFETIMTGKLFELTDADQFEIAKSQYLAEHIMKTVCGPDVMIITDTAVLNTLLYMTPEFSQRPEVQDLLAKAMAHYDLLFLCYPVPRLNVLDPNRIHTDEESQLLHLELEELVKSYGANTTIIPLLGPSNHRLQQAVTSTLQKKDSLS